MPDETHSNEHSSLIRTPKQLIIVVVLAFLVPIVLISMIAHLVTSGPDTSKNNPALSEEAVAKRLKPVGEVAVDPNQPKPAPVAATPAPVAAVPAAVPPAKGGADTGKGKQIYDATCMVCHAAGVANAPKLGDKAAWAPRIATGVETLYASSLKGKNAMPPKGGQVNLPDADVKAAVDYMVAQAK